MTIEEAIKRLKDARFTVQPYQYINEALDMAIKALEQELVLDKIRAEINEEYRVESEHPYGQGLRRALQIIDKYRVESEE